MIQKLNLRRRTYIVLCIVACVTPIALIFAQHGIGVLTPVGAHDDMLFAFIGTFAASLLTYPAGVLGTVLSWIPIYFGVLTATESVLFAAPVYIGAGYFQWYVLIPKHFEARPNPALNSDTPPSGGAPV